jgi:hypothetical protein
VDFYVPAYMDFWRTWANTLAVPGRLKPGVSVAQAHAGQGSTFYFTLPVEKKEMRHAEEPAPPAETLRR